MINAFSAMNCNLIKEKDTWLLPKNSSDFKNRLRLEEELDSIKRISFSTQTGEGIEYVDRDHILVERTATHILETALGNMNHSLASRRSFTITDSIEKRTTLLLLRLRHLIKTIIMWFSTQAIVTGKQIGRASCRERVDVLV